MEMEELLGLAPVDEVPHSADRERHPTANPDKDVVDSRP